MYLLTLGGNWARKALLKRKLVSVTEGHPEAKEGLDKGGEPVPGVVIRWLRELTASNAAVVWLSLPLSRP